MSNLFIVSTPHHLLSLKSSYYKMSCQRDNNILIVFAARNYFSEFKHIIESIGIKFTKIYFAETWNFHKDKVSECLIRICKYKYLCNVIKRNYKIKQLFIIQYRTDYSHYLIGLFNGVPVYLLDEGNASYIWVQDRKMGLVKFPFLKQILFGFNLKDENAINFISQYKLSVKKEDKLLYVTLGEVFSANNFTKDDAIYFLGGDYSHAGVIDYSYYLAACKTTIERFKQNRLIYIPHRFETDRDLELIKQIGFDVLKIDLPIELYFIETKIAPKGIISMYSAAIQNLHSIFQNDTVVFYVVVIEDSEIHKNIEAIQEIHNYYNSLRSDNFHILK